MTDLLNSYLAGDISAKEFANNHHNDFQRELKIHAQISHYQNNLISEDNFRRSIAEIASRYPSYAWVQIKAYSINDNGELVPLEVTRQ
jgi:hypothetical protein